MQSKAKKNDHIKDLLIIFELMRVHQLKMNPTKSFLEVSSENYLGFVVMSKGIHLDPGKIKAIQDMQSPRNIKELKGLYGCLTYIYHFIAI